MSVYNEPIEFIKASITSIQDQSYKLFSVVIIVDNPKVSVEVIDFLNNLQGSDNRFTIHRNRNNDGLANSLNTAVSKVDLSEFEYIARMDSDDICVKNRFEVQVQYLNSNVEVDLVGSSAFQIDENNNRLKDFSVRSGPVFLDYGSNSIHPTWMMRKSIFIDLGGYRNFECAQDYDFLCRASLKGYKIVNISDFLIFYRLRSGSIGAKKRLLQRRIKFYISCEYRRKKLLSKNIPIFNSNLMCDYFNYIESKKLEKGMFSRLLYPFSFYHMKNIYFIHMKNRKVDCGYRD